jgi:hypothetical protein
LEIYCAGVKELEVWTGEQLAGSADNLMTYGYFTENREFVDNVRAGQDGEINLAEHLKTLELCERIKGGEYIAPLRAEEPMENTAALGGGTERSSGTARRSHPSTGSWRV